MLLYQNLYNIKTNDIGPNFFLLDFKNCKLSANFVEKKLEASDLMGGSFSITNPGMYGSLHSQPIINQPQVAIMACGVIKKKPVVLEIEHGDVIAIRHMMYLSLSYDHRVVDGSLGGQFVKRVADYLEKFDTNTVI